MSAKTMGNIAMSDLNETINREETAGSISYTCVNTAPKNASEAFGRKKTRLSNNGSSKRGKKTIPIFFAADDNYLPFLAVSLRSVKDNASKNVNLKIYVLHSGLKGNDAETIMNLDEERFSISFIDVSERLNAVAESLQLRDYYTCTTYYRVFIASMFPQYDKALYLDSDTIILGDIAELYSYDLGDNLIGAVPDQSVAVVAPFGEYTKNALGIEGKHYFNAGIISMNLKKFRESDFYGKFCELLGKYKFEVAQDQDYLNVLCQGKVKFIDPAWNVMPIGAASKTQPKLVHYNLTRKPWHYTDVRYQDYFWEYAKKTEFYDRIMQHLRSFTAENAQRDAAGEQHLIDMCIREAGNENNYYRTFGDSAKIADTFAARK